MVSVSRLRAEFAPARRDRLPACPRDGADTEEGNTGMAIKIVKNSVRKAPGATPAPAPVRTPPAPSKPAAPAPCGALAMAQAAHAPSSSARVKWTVAGVVLAVVVAVYAAYAAKSRRVIVEHPDIGGRVRGSARVAGPTDFAPPSSSLDNVDLRKWSEENDKNNEMLQARRARMRGRSER